MDPRQTRIKEIFSEAHELHEPQRTEFVVRACGADLELRTEVEKLLSSFAEPGELLESSLGAFLFKNAEGKSTEGPSTLREGDLIGSYRIIKLIGCGGMGEVYEAEDSRSGQPVAIKTLRHQFILSPEIHARFRREINLASQIHHDNVCEIYDFGSQNIRDTDVEYVTMKLLNGVTLAQLLRDGPLPLAEVKAIVEQVAAGLTALHDHEIIHRDLKPANIMLTGVGEERRAVIMDFGLAQSFQAGHKEETLTFSGQLIGTPSYMAPEQLTGEQSGPESDIYALGIVMYQMLVGRRPFEATNMFEAAAQKLAEDAEPLSTHIDIGRDWEKLVTRCLQRERAARFRTASELLDSVRRLSLRKRRWPRLPRLATFRRTRHWRRASLASLKRRPMLITSVATAIFVIAATLQIRPVRASVLRRGCETFPGSPWLCELPADRSIAVLPFEVSGASAEKEALARGAARSIRESFARLVPGQDKMCVHLRTDKLAEGVGLVLQGSISAVRDGVTVALWIRESHTGEPVLLRKVEQTFSAGETPDLVPNTLLAISRALDLRLSGREWDAWLQSIPRNERSVTAYLTGLGWLETQEYERAANEFNTAVDPTRSFNYAAAHVGMGDAHRSLFNRTREPVAALRARQAYQRAIPLDRDFGFAGAEKSLGELAIATSQQDEAVERFRTALKLWPYDQAAQKRLVSVLESQGKVPEAVTILEQGAKRMPLCWLSHNTLASMYSRHGRLREAEASLLQAIRLSPFNAIAYHNLAFDYLKLGRYDDAIDMASKAISLRSSGLAYSTLGRGFLHKGCGEDALVNLREAIEADPDSFIVWANLADALSQLEPGTRRWAAATVRTATLSRQALEKAPNYALAASHYGLNLARSGQRAEAIPYLMQAQRDGALDSGVLLTVAEGFYTAADRSKALGALTAALSRGATSHEMKARSGLAPLLSSAKAAGVVFGEDLDAAPDAGGLVVNRLAGCPGWKVAGKGLQVN